MSAESEWVGDNFVSAESPEKNVAKFNEWNRKRRRP
jgi:hypothetical protein